MRKSTQVIHQPSSSNNSKNNNYLNVLAGHTGVFVYPHQVNRMGSIPLPAMMNKK